MNTELDPPPAPIPAPPPPSKPLRWLASLLILAMYPLGIGLLSTLGPERDGGTSLPTDILILLKLLLIQFAAFLVIFGLAWLVSGGTREELFIRWKGGLGPLWRGFLYSIGLRVMILIVVLFILLLGMVALGWDKDSLSKMRPQTEQVVDPKALASNPLYLLINLTLVSFVFAGFREELWRGGMLASFRGLFPKLYETITGKIVAMTLVGIVFGLGHLPQGWGGVAITSILGLGLGAIIVFHHTIWDAVIAHGFFDATTFLALYLLAPYWADLISK